jgi:hypothetical protein
MFSILDRDRARDHVLDLAKADARVVAGAVVGSLALGEGDRWSDLDLTFGVADGVPLASVLDDFTADVVQHFGAVPLFDLPSGPTIFRVFLFPGCLQFDISFTPASEFGAVGPTFRLLFGSAGTARPAPLPHAPQLFGYAVHHALRARFCIERGRYWQAEYWTSAVRDYALSLACLRRGLPASYGRGVDELPQNLRDDALGAICRSLKSDELLRALGQSVDLLLAEAGDVPEVARAVEPQLRQLTSADWH